MYEDVDIRELYTKKTEEYVATCHQNHIPLKSKAAIFRELNKEIPSELQCSQSHFYKHLDHMRFYLHSPYDYGFDDKRIVFSDIICSHGLRNQITFVITRPELGTLMATAVNNHFYAHSTDYKKYFHCIAVQDVLTCFYRKTTKLEPYELKHETLNSLIPQILEDYYIDTKQI